MKKLFLTSVAANTLESFVKLTKINPSEINIGFIANAADLYTDKWFVEKDRNKFIELWFQIINVDIKNEQYTDISKKLESVDIIFVAGGNVFYLLQEMKKNNIDILINAFVKGWKTYIWSSAWSIVAGPDIWLFRNIDSLQDAPELSSYKWINLTDYVVIPHCDNDKFKNKINKAVEENINHRFQIIKLNDNQSVFIEWDKLNFVECDI